MDCSCASAIRISLLILLVVAIVTACFTLPIEQMLKDFLLWVENDLGAWGPLVLSIAYIPLTVLAVPASILTLGGGYLYGMVVGFIADSLGSTLGATAAFLLGRTIGRPYVLSKVKDYPKFRAVVIAVQRSGFKIVLMLRLVPLLPYNMLNYLLSVTPVPLGQYMLASWLGMMPMTMALVYAGTTLKDLSDITHGWHEFSPSRWIFLMTSLLVSVLLIISVTRVAKNALEKALEEHEDLDGVLATNTPVPISNANLPADLRQPLIVKIDDEEETPISTNNPLKL